MVHRFHRIAGIAVLTAVAVLPLVDPAPAVAADAVPVARTAVAGPSPSSGPRLVFRGDGQQPVEQGDEFRITVLDMPAGWDEVSVASAALVEPVRLVPRSEGATDSDPDRYQAGATVRMDVDPGTYSLVATSHGRVVTSAELKVSPYGPARIGRFGVWQETTVLGDPVRPGSRVNVLLGDAHPLPGEDVLVAKSPAFTRDVKIRRDGPEDPACKCDDGSTLFTGHTTLRDDLPVGTYPLTVASHDGRETHTTRITVAGEPVTPSRSWALWGVPAVLAVLCGAGIALRLRRKNTGPA